MLDFKQVIVIRRDLKMGTGKTAVQAAHASTLGVVRVRSERRRWFDEWYNTGQAKIAVKVKNLDELREVKKHAEILDLPVVQVDDSGLTQLPPGTTTCIAIGPAPTELIDKVTQDLKLL
ncbi:MAG: peptidyl-tRNA hydrolase Pth2 [Nitrososphaerales archaeon]